MKERLFVYVDGDLAKRVHALASGRGATKSGIVSAALDSYTRAGPDDVSSSIKTRMDKLSVALARVERHQQVLIETLALFVRYQLSITPPLPESEQAAARAKGSERFNSFIDQVGRRLIRGQSLAEDVLERAASAQSQEAAR